jgi:hypothetical protein
MDACGIREMIRMRLSVRRFPSSYVTSLNYARFRSSSLQQLNNISKRYQYKKLLHTPYFIIHNLAGR